MRNVLVLGAGKLGVAVAYTLVDENRIRLLEKDADTLERKLAMDGLGSCEGIVLDVANKKKVMEHLKWADIAVFAVDASLNLDLTRWCIEAGCHAIDFGGNEQIAIEQRLYDPLASKAGVTIIPEVSFLPGLASFFISDGISELDIPESATVFFGCLPTEPIAPLNFGLYDAPERIAKEYVGTVKTLCGGGVMMSSPYLGSTKCFQLGHDIYEAFLAGGAFATLAEKFEGKLETLESRAIRFKGHLAEIEKMPCIQSVGEFPLDESDSLVAELAGHLAESLPSKYEDYIMLLVSVEGKSGGFSKRIYYQMTDNEKNDSYYGSVYESVLASIVGSIIERILTGRTSRSGVYGMESVDDRTALAEDFSRWRLCVLKTIAQPEWGHTVALDIVD
ncbi:saccharopine dehydrogenase NADP-binding domain-containing protein [bacterium]|nr:saccharopine dehydrogenase NADP-binding domain-containing protein [bacterium]